MLSNLTGWHFIVILFIVLLLFGAPKLPTLARSVGQSMKILKTELKPGDDAAATPPATTTPAADAATPLTTPPTTLTKATATPPV